MDDCDAMCAARRIMCEGFGVDQLGRSMRAIGARLVLQLVYLHIVQRLPEPYNVLYSELAHFLCYIFALASSACPGY